jgi:hypothetical protein
VDGGAAFGAGSAVVAGGVSAMAGPGSSAAGVGAVVAVDGGTVVGGVAPLQLSLPESVNPPPPEMGTNLQS